MRMPMPTRPVEERLREITPGFFRAISPSRRYIKGVFRFPPLTPLVRTCLVTFLVAYVGLLIAINWLGQAQLGALLALNTTTGPWIGNAWQVITYVLVHDTSPNGVMSFLISSLFFWWIVVPYEQTFGTKRTIQILIASMLGGSLPALAIGVLVPDVLFGFGPLIVGPIAAWAWAMRTLKQEINLFGVWPMKPTTLILLLLGITALDFLASRSFMNLVADLGAVGAGILFTERMSRPPTPRTRKKSGGRRRGPALQVIEGGKDDAAPPGGWLN